MYFPLANVRENSASVVAYAFLHSYQYYLTKRETYYYVSVRMIDGQRILGCRNPRLRAHL